MKKILSAFFVLVALGALGVGIFLWQATKGVPASKLEAIYLTAADRFVEIDGARVRIREEGDPSSPPVVLIHGFTHSLETWNGWAEILKADYRVIRYDLLGHGLTGPDPQKRYSPQERAAFLGEVLAALEIENPVIAGNSLGGLAAWRFALSNPDQVRGLILVSPGAFSLNGVNDEPADIPAAMQAYLLTAPEAGVRASAEFIYGDDAKITEERLTLMRDMMRREGNGAAMIASLEEFTLPDPTDDLAQIKTPMLILWGEDDVIIPIDQGRMIESIVPGARLVSFPGVGHAAQEEAPSATAAEAVLFLQQQVEQPDVD